MNMKTKYKTMIKERIEAYGVEALLDNESISSLTGIPADELSEYIDTFGLPEIIKYIDSMDITKLQREKLEILFNIAKRINLSSYKDRVVLINASIAGEYFKSQLQFNSTEVFLLALLDTQNRLLRTVVISKGTINEAMVYPREIVKIALNNNANSVILSHNHPAGSRNPSTQDIDVTHKIEAALKTVNIKVLDHIIIAENKYISMKEIGAI